jgi:Uma2 family endonuclease
MSTRTDMPMTVQALDGAPDDGNRYEVIEGELYVSTAPGIPHQSVLGNLYWELGNYLKSHRVGHAYLGIGIVYDDFNGVIPDLLFVSSERLNRILAVDRLKASPEIVIEILSPGASNENRDRTVKRKLYSSRGVSEYWIVNPETRTIAVSRKRKEGGLKPAVVLNDGDDLTTPILPEFRVPVAQIFE